MISAVDPRMAALAGHGLPRRPELVVDGWDECLDAVFGHGLTGFLRAAWEDGSVRLGRGSVDRLEERLDDEACLAVRLEAEILRLAPLLEHWRAVALKGPVLAHEAYPSPELRPFTDIDLLVAAAAIRPAIEGLLGLGYERPRPDPCPRFAELVGKATVLVHPAGVAVDLHRTLVAGKLDESIRVDDIVAGRRVARAGAVAVPAPSWEAHLVEVALHAVVGDELRRAISLRDVVQVASHPALDPAAATALAEEWHVGEVVATGLVAAHRDLGVPLPDRLVAWADTRAVVPVPIGTHESFTARSRLDEMRQGGLARRATLLRALLAPSPVYLRWRYGDQPLPTLYRRRWRDLRDRTADAWR